MKWEILFPVALALGLGMMVCLPTQTLRRFVPGLVASYGAALVWIFGPVIRHASPFGVCIAAIGVLGVLGGFSFYLIERRWPAILLRVCLGVLLTFGLFLLAHRAVFVVNEGGMERADGYGSPLAFLIGLVFEQLLFTIPAAALWLGLPTFRHGTEPPAAPPARWPRPLGRRK